MNITMSNVHFVRYYPAVNMVEGREDLRALTTEEAETYWDIVSNWESGVETKIDRIATLCITALPDALKCDEDTLDVSYDVEYTL